MYYSRNRACLRAGELWIWWPEKFYGPSETPELYSLISIFTLYRPYIHITNLKLMKMKPVSEILCIFNGRTRAWGRTRPSPRVSQRTVISETQGTTSYLGLFINNPGTGHKVLNSDWPIKTHNPRSKILESRQINIANTTFESFDSTLESNKRRILQRNCFPRATDASKKCTRTKWPT